MKELVKLYISDLRKVNIDSIIPFLKEEDLKNANTFKMEKDKNIHILSSYLKRKYIGEYKLSESNKPYSDKIYFNISHSNNLVVLSTSLTYNIGVDIELIKEIKENVKEYISSKEEYEYIKTDKNFFEIWTSKESLAKAIGTGIKDIKNIKALPIEGTKEYKDKTFYSKIIYYNDYIISITLESKEDYRVVIEEL